MEGFLLRMGADFNISMQDVFSFLNLIQYCYLDIEYLRTQSTILILLTVSKTKKTLQKDV